jgi:hypothetical protein
MLWNKPRIHTGTASLLDIRSGNLSVRRERERKEDLYEIARVVEGILLG